MGDAIAIYGGTFDPVHRGHLTLAQVALDQLDVESVRFLPAGRPPHKSTRPLTPIEHRLRMLELAVASLGRPSRFTIDTRELEREGPSYTVLSLEELRTELPETQLLLLLGGDNVPLIKGWYRAARILELCDPVVLERPGHRARFTHDDLPFVGEGRIEALNRRALTAPPDTVAAETLRKRVRDGESIRELVPDAVADYITAHRLYGD